jgi:hypothetical protein
MPASIQTCHSMHRIRRSFCGNATGTIDDQRGHDVRHVVHGHHPFKDGPITIEGRTNLDTLAWHTGRLVVGVFDDDVPGGPVSLLEVRGEPVEAKPKARERA